MRLRLPVAVRDLLRCPVCRERLLEDDFGLRCVNDACGGRFPVVNGVPVLLNEKRSLFRIDEVAKGQAFASELRREGRQRLLRTLIPTISRNIKARANLARFARLLLERPGEPRVLVIGGGTLGAGMNSLLSSPSIQLVETDVTLGGRAMLVVDGHDIPFADESFDGVIIQAVLEYLVEPGRCVDEIHRVLKPQGLVYAETPFMQQVHGGRLDFNRFTHLGHRRLFRKFTEIASGAVCGPGMALAWAWEYFLSSFAESRGLRRLLVAFACLTSFYLKYFDYVLVNKKGAYDAASAYYFLGRKSEHVLPDRELTELYGGMLEAASRA
jgi:SAM-dependent methyltransferase/uncharacterized protein YbaR (Trm112 family)